MLISFDLAHVLTQAGAEVVARIGFVAEAVAFVESEIARV